MSNCIRGRIFWFLNGDQSVASARIHGINIHNKLRELGYRSIIVSKPERKTTDLKLGLIQKYYWLSQLKEGDVVFFLKLEGDRTIKLIELIGTRAKVFFIDSDLPLAVKMALKCDGVICPSEFLQHKYQEAGVEKVYYIPDCPEVFMPYRGRKGAKTFTCVWYGIGNKKKWESVLYLKHLLERPVLKNWRLITISDHPDASFSWTSDAWNIINSSDATVIPAVQMDEWAFAKSSNRVLQAMALSSPVLASAIPEYKKVIKNLENGILCDSDDDWVNGLKRLEEDYLFRAQLAENAHSYALGYHIDNIINRWRTILEC